ncbi:MAG: ATP-binding cassette domain-containing protein [Xanthobacteraceae bacterium]
MNSCRPEPSTSRRSRLERPNSVNTVAEDDRTYLRIENLSKVYATRDGEVRALDGVSFAQRRGEFISHVGPSGCGKSTLLMIAAGLVPSSSGAVCGSTTAPWTGRAPTSASSFRIPSRSNGARRSATSCCRPKPAK